MDGDTPKEERRDLIRALGTGEVQMLTNCGLISEGLDVPGVGRRHPVAPDQIARALSATSWPRAAPGTGQGEGR